MLDRSLFSRYLDLSPLKGRSRGRVLCPFHAERTPSFSVDLEGGVFHCFGCGVEGGLKDFAQLLVQRGSARAEELAWSQPWADDFAQARRQFSERIKASRRDVERLRAAATDTPAGWAMLAEAARLETLTNAAESEGDEAMP